MKSFIFQLLRLKPEVVALYLVILSICLITLINLLNLVSIEHPINYGEGPILDQIVRLIRGENIYRIPLSQNKQVISNYPPVVHIINIPFIDLFGVGYTFARAINLAAFLCSCMIVYLLIKKLNDNSAAGFIGALSIFSMGRLNSWSTYLRVDSLALLFELLAILMATSTSFSRLRVGTIAGLVILSFLARQSNGIFAMLTITYLIYSKRDYRLLLNFFFYSLVLGILAWALLYIKFEDGIFLHLFKSNLNPLSFKQLITYFSDFLISSPITPFVLAASGYYLIKENTKKNILNLGVVMLIGSLPSVLAMSKIGSASNYLMQFGIAVSVLSGFLFSVCNSRFYRFLFLILVACQAEFGRIIVNSNVASEKRIVMSLRLKNFLKNVDGSIFGDEVMGYLPIIGKRIEYQPFEMQQLHRTGLYPEKFILNRLRNRDFDFVVISNTKRPKFFNADRWSRQQLITIMKCYEFKIRILHEYIFKPKAKCSTGDITTKRTLFRLIKLTNEVSRKNFPRK